MWTYLLKNKSVAFDAFKRFRALVENSPDKRIMTFRTENGGEFKSREFTEYCEEAGISRHFSAPYSPQQNGVVERRNRTLIEMSRSLLKEMKMPNYFWGEAVRHSTYLLNRLPTRALTGITPYEAWSGKKPHMEHLKVFGCVAHMKVPAVNLKKLDNRSKMVICLGKEPGSKAYRLYDPKAQSICVSRDVIFEEGKCWNWKEEAGSNMKLNTPFTVITREYSVTFENSTQQMKKLARKILLKVIVITQTVILQMPVTRVRIVPVLDQVPAFHSQVLNLKKGLKNSDLSVTYLLTLNQLNWMKMSCILWD